MYTLHSPHFVRGYGVVLSTSDGVEGFLMEQAGSSNPWSMRNDWIPDEALPIGPNDRIPREVTTALQAVIVASVIRQ